MRHPRPALAPSRVSPRPAGPRRGQWGAGSLPSLGATGGVAGVRVPRLHHTSESASWLGRVNSTAFLLLSQTEALISPCQLTAKQCHVSCKALGLSPGLGAERLPVLLHADE